MQKNAKRNRKSLIHRLVIWMCLLIGVLAVVLTTTYLYLHNIVQANTVSLSENAVSIYVNDINNSLINMSKTLDEVAFNTAELSNLNDSQDSQRYFTSENLLNVLNAKINYGTDADAYFIKNTGNDLVLTSFSGRVSGGQIAEVNAYLQGHDIASVLSEQNKWGSVRVGDSFYYLKYYDIDQNDIGVLVSAETMMSYVKQTVGEKNGYVLTDDQGNCISAAGVKAVQFSAGSSKLANSAQVVIHTSQNELIVTGKVPECGARLSNVIARSSVFQGFTVIQWVLILLVLLCLCMVVFLLLFLNREVMEPVRQLIGALRDVRSGHLERQVEYAASTREMDLLKRTFNHMTRQIRHLKIRSYEEKISRQKVELRYLQMQIRPHFYLNALTTVHSMTYKNKNEQIRSFIEALSNHLRYTLRDGVSKVTFAEEVRHIGDYIRMQEIRFPNSVLFVADVAPEAQNGMIPQFLILTFVENAFKYAMSLDTELSLLLKGRRMERNGRAYLQIVFEDNGKGYPEEVIRRVNAQEEGPAAADGGQIGLHNVKKTLALFYGKEGELVISNSRPTGARVEITLPFSEEGEHEAADR